MAIITIPQATQLANRDGTPDGYLAVEEPDVLYTNATVLVYSRTQPTIRCIITDIVGEKVGLRKLNSTSVLRSDMSAYLVADGATVFQPSQSIDGTLKTNDNEAVGSLPAADATDSLVYVDADGILKQSDDLQADVSTVSEYIELIDNNASPGPSGRVRLRSFSGSLQVSQDGDTYVNVIRPDNDLFRESVYSVVDYGAVGDGSTDDAAAFQEAADAAGAAGGGTVWIPVGTFKINSTITVNDKKGVRFKGESSASSIIEWGGSSGQSIFLFINCYECGTEDLRVHGNSNAGNRPKACYESQIDTTQPITHGVTKNFARYCWFGGAAANSTQYCLLYSKAPGGNDQNNEFGYFERCEFRHATVAAVSIQHSQSKTHTFIECSVAYAPIGVENNPSGSFRWYGGAAANNTDADFYLADVSEPIVIDGFNSEGANRFLRTGGPSGNGCPVVIRNCRWAGNGLNADGNMIRFQFRGALLLEGNSFQVGSPVNLIPYVSMNSNTYTFLSMINNQWEGGGQDVSVVDVVRITGPTPENITLWRLGNMYSNAAGSELPRDEMNYVRGSFRNTKQYGGTVQAPAFSATPSFDPASGETIHYVLTGNVTSWSLASGLAGEVVTIHFVQDGSGNHTLAGTPANVLLAGNSLTLSIGANKVDSITLRWNSSLSKWVEQARALNC